jgi:hypothetical protein
MTGALTYATTSLIVPAKEKMYFVYNNTSGGFAVTVKVSGQTGILVPNGKKVVLACNGTDIVEAHTAIVGNATMGGTLGVTGVTTVAAGSAALPAIVSTTGTADTGLWFPAADTVAASTGGTERIRIDSSGNVGIGTSSPNTKLQVYKAAASAFTGTSPGALIVTDSTNTLNYFTSIDFNTTNGPSVPYARIGMSYTSGGSTMSFGTSNSYASGITNTAMLIDPSGNVGIGTTSPRSVAGYQTLGIDASTVSVLDLFVAGTRTATVSATSTSVNLTAVTAVPLIFNTTNTERMRIDTSGNLLVGQSTLNGRVSVLGVVGAYAIIAAAPSTSGIYYYQSFTTSGGFQTGYILSTDGSSTLYSTSSDYRLKDNVVPMVNGLATVNLLKPVTYSWKASGFLNEGFIAHELAEVIPLAVTGEKDSVNEDGSIKPQGVDYSKIVVHLVAAIQELSAKVTALESK